MPVLARMIAVLVFLIAPLNSAPTATVSSSFTGTPLPPLKYPKGAVKINLGGREIMVNQQAMGTGATKATIRAIDDAFAKIITSATNINFDACHQPLVLTSNRFLALGCSTVAAGSAAVNDLSWNSGTDTYAWTPSYGSLTAFSTTNYFGRSLQDSGNFVYSLKNSTKAASNDVLVYKLDGSVPQSIGSATMVTCTLFASGPQGREINWLADPYIFVVYSTVTTFAQEGIAIIDKTSMTQVGIYPTTKLNSIVERYRSTQNLFFIANENSATTYGFSKVLIGASPTFGVTVQGFWATGGSDIVTMWASPLMSTVYVHVAASSPTNLVQLVNAYTMSTEGTLTFTETPVRYAPTLWSTTTGREYYHTIGTAAPGSATMFTRTMVWLDFCLTPGQNPCLQCQAGRYLNSALTENLCVTTYDFPAGYGINGFYMGPCLGDLAKGCLVCPATTSVCTVCDTANGFYLETISGQCYSVATMPAGFGLNTGTNLVEACTTANCQKCSSDKTVCTGCIPGYYIRVSTNTCVLNNVAGYGLDVSTLTIKGCSSSNCLDCYSDITQCNQCSGGDFLYFHNRSCTTVAGDGYGPQTITGTTYLVNCLTSSCQTCSLDYSACTKCKKGNVLTPENKCISIEPIRLTNTPLLDKETYIFDLEFSDTIDQEDYLSLLNYQCYDINQRQMSLDKCSFGLTRTRNLTVQGQFHHSLDLSTLNQIVISHRDIEIPAFHNARKKFVEENDISITPRKNLESTVNSTYAKPVIISTMAVSAFTVTALMNRELPLLKVIDTLEYILYENGIHMWKSDSFIRSVDAKPFAILPNMLGSDKENLKCLAPVNFAKEGISCSLLNNYGAELLTLIMFLVVGFIFAGLNVFIERVSLKFPNMTDRVNEKYPKFAKYSKKILGYFTALLSRQILVKVFEGSQIGIFRLAFLNLYTLNTEAPMIWGAIVSCILLLLNILLGISFFKFAKTRSQLIIKCVEMKRKYEHVLEIPPPPNDQIACLLVAPLYFEYKITAKGKKSIHLWYPLMELLYNAIVQCILVVTTGDNLVQVWLITCATLAHFGVVSWMRPYIHRILNLKLALQTFIFGAIQITIVAVNHSKDHVPPLDREKGFAWTLIILCCGAIVVNLIPTFFTVYELLAPIFQRGKNRAVSPIFKKSAFSAFSIILQGAENQSSINASTFEKTNRKEEETKKKKKKIKMYLRPDKNTNIATPVADEKGGKLEFDASKEDICEQNGKYKNEVSTSRTMRPSISKENTNEEGHSPEPNLRASIKKRKNQTTGSPVPAGKKRVKSPSSRKT